MRCSKFWEVERVLKSDGSLTLIPEAYGGDENLLAQLMAAEDDPIGAPRRPKSPPTIPS